MGLLQKPKEQKYDLTNLTGISVSSEQTNPVQIDSKEIRLLQLQQMKHNALNNLSFKGMSSVKLLDRIKTGEILYRSGSNPEEKGCYLGHNTYDRIYEKIYKPECWESVKPGESVWRNGHYNKEMWNIGEIEVTDNGLHDVKSCSKYIPDVIAPSFTREESLFRIAEIYKEKAKYPLTRREVLKIELITVVF